MSVPSTSFRRSEDPVIERVAELYETAAIGKQSSFNPFETTYAHAANPHAASQRGRPFVSSSPQTPSARTGATTTAHRACPRPSRTSLRAAYSSRRARPRLPRRAASRRRQRTCRGPRR